MHGAEAIARFTDGIIGNIISFFLFLAPLPTFIRIFKNKSTEEFHPYPYLATSLNCMFWIFYGLPIVHPNSTLVVTINTIGLVLEIMYLSFFFYYTIRKNRVIIIAFFLGELALVGVIACITLLCFDTHKARSMFVGIICVIFGVIMYASPLSIVRKVYQTKSAEFLPFWLCLAGFLNGAVWFVYAFLQGIDPYLATANGTGAVLGLIQLAVHAYYTYRAKKTRPVQDGIKLQKHNVPQV